jgi:hypothetical protein
VAIWPTNRNGLPTDDKERDYDVAPQFLLVSAEAALLAAAVQGQLDALRSATTLNSSPVIVFLGVTGTTAKPVINVGLSFDRYTVPA